MLKYTKISRTTLRTAKYVVSAILLLLAPAPVFSEIPKVWNLPCDLSEKNTKIEFDIKTTWNTIRVATNRVAGDAWLDDPRDFTSVRINLRLPVQAFAAEDSDVDEDIMEAMDASSFPEVQFESKAIDGLCPPKDVDAGKVCQGMMQGIVRIRDTEKPLLVPYRIQRAEKGYRISGQVAIEWPNFGVKDLSTIFYTVKSAVTVDFDSYLNDKQDRS